MKKLVTLLGILLVASLFSCKDVGDIEGDKLGVSAEASGNIVAVPFEDSVNYVNIFRKDESGNEVNIGQIIPSAKNKHTTVPFKDELVNDGAKYTYCARYNVKKGVYKYSGWSDEVTSINGSSYEQTINVGLDKFIQSDDSMKIELSGTGITPSAGYNFSTNNYKLVMAVSNSTSTSTFEISATPSLTTGTSINLTSVLNTKYFNTSLKLKGVLLQQIQLYPDGSDASNYECKIVHWTEIVPIDLEKNSDPGNNIKDDFKVLINVGDGDDFDYQETTLPTRKMLAEERDWYLDYSAF